MELPKQNDFTRNFISEIDFWRSANNQNVSVVKELKKQIEKLQEEKFKLNLEVHWLNSEIQRLKNDK